MADNLSDAPLASSGAVSGASAEAPAAAAAAPAKPNFVGTIDKVAYGRLSGWAVNMQGEPCGVMIRLNGKDVATVTSDQERADLAAKKYSRGLGGWYADLGAMLTPGKNIIEARFTDGTMLAHSPFEYEPQASNDDIAPAATATGTRVFHGAIDSPQSNIISGWSISSDFRAAAVVIQVNDREPVTIGATTDRPDLIQQQLIKSGGGWSYEVGPLLVQGFNLISVRYPDGKHLPGSPIERQNGENPAGFVKRTAPPQPVRATEPVAAAPKPAPAAPQPTPAQTIQVAMSPFTRKPVVADAPAPATSNVTPFPDRLAARNGMPSLSELDELSLDDLSLAIAAGMINVSPAVAHEPVPDPQPTEAEIERDELARRPGFFARLFGRG
jgi:hypothetical protein